MTPEELDRQQECIDKNICPVCGENLINEGGCWHCIKCGWSACDN